MAETQAVLFDFGGTLYDYATLVRGGRESLIELVRGSGRTVPTDRIVHAHREALRRVFQRYLPRPYYLHRELFRDTVSSTLESLGVDVGEGDLERYERRLRERQVRDLELREGVLETLARLRERGLAGGMVSNIDDEQLRDLVRAAKLEDRFDWLLSSESARSCKPDPGIFRQALNRCACEPNQALFVGDSLKQDIAGARRAGLRAVLLWHREGRDPPAADPAPDHVVARIPEILGLIR